MQFNSIAFIFHFLPLLLAAYYIFPSGLRNAVLLCGSLVFYFFAGGIQPVLMLLGCTVLCYVAALTLDGKRAKMRLAIYLLLLILILGFYKRFDGGGHLPAGMSFYMFQLAAYLIDVYREKVRPQGNLITFASRIVMFPKLLSGPLVQPSALHDAQPEPTVFRFREGVHLLILGLGLKVILANRIGGLWAQAGVTGFDVLSTPAAWLALTAFSMQLYFDFYGYSLMAMGLGKMLGFDLPRNFDDPYAAKTVSAFYRRWHMTLGLWFREYVYIPLGGNRRGACRTILNLAFVWGLTGIWHGTGGNYLLWAGFLFLMIVNERLWLGKWLEKSHILSRVYLIGVILLSWVPFAVDDFVQMITFLRCLFGCGAKPANPQDWLQWAENFAGLLIVGIIFATPLPKKLWEKLKNSILADILLVVLFWVSIYFISTAAQDPFLYFRY